MWVIVNIIQDRVENLKSEKTDVITSRAMTSLDKLLTYSKPFCKDNTKMIFPKGEKWQEEVKQAQRKMLFNYIAMPSETNEKSCILIIKNMRRKKNG